MKNVTDIEIGVRNGNFVVTLTDIDGRQVRVTIAMDKDPVAFVTALLAEWGK